MPTAHARSVLKALWDAVPPPFRLAQALPQTCALCGHWPGPGICAPCLQACSPSLPRCPRCALAHPGGREAQGPLLPCGRCLRSPPSWQSARALYPYAYPWSWLIRRWKFQQECHWADWFGAQLRACEPMEQLRSQADWVVPLPSHPARLRERGYDPVGRLAQAWVPSRQRLQALDAPAHAVAQHRLGRSQRLQRAAVWQCHPDALPRLRASTVILLDDVLTTGATATAATRALLEAGASAVHLVVVARTD